MMLPFNVTDGGALPINFPSERFKVMSGPIGDTGSTLIVTLTERTLARHNAVHLWAEMVSRLVKVLNVCRSVQREARMRQLPDVDVRVALAYDAHDSPVVELSDDDGLFDDDNEAMFKDALVSAVRMAERRVSALLGAEACVVQANERGVAVQEDPNYRPHE
jgi:hypothetical protein